MKFMKKIISKIPKKALAFGGALVATLAFSAVAIANFGPDRPTRVWTAEENGFDYVTYNSYTGVPNGIGDERDFLRGVVTGRDSNWVDPVADIANEDTVTAKIYIHNNADPLLNDAEGNPGIARDVNVKIEIPEGLKADHEVMASISASNAQPKTVFDSLDLSGVNDSIFKLNYVPGSAKMGGQTLSDSIFTTGIKLDDQKGCFEFIREITFELEVEKPGYQIQKTARLKGEDSTRWRKEVNAKRGDTIEWRISFQNIGTMQLDDVKVVDDLPSYTDVVPNTVELVNSNFPNGYKYDSSAIQDNGDQVNIDIADYMPGSNAFVYLETKIEDHEDIQCGIHQIANVVYVTPSGLGTLNDNAKVNIINDETCAEPVTACTSLTATKLELKIGETSEFTAIGSVEGDATIEGYIFEVNGEVVQDSESDNYTFTAEEAGEHTVRATIKFSNGNKTSDDCVKTVVVDAEIVPIYSCDALKVTHLKNRTFRFDVETTAKNGASVKSYHYNFADDSEILMTDKSSVDHTYPEDGTYVPSVAVTFDVNGEMITVEGDNCSKTIKIDSEVPMCPLPGKGHLPKDHKDCREEVKGTTTELPNTGAGSVAGIMAAAGAVGTALHRRLTLRRK